MASKAEVVQSAVKEALDSIKKYSLEEFKEVNADSNLKERLSQAAHQAAEEELKLAHLTHFSELEKHLPDNHTKAIKGGLAIPTYKLSFRKEGRATFIDITRNGKQFKPTINLQTSVHATAAEYIQYASILIEGVMLAMSAVGIIADIDETTLARVAEDVEEFLKKFSVLQKMMKMLQEVYEKEKPAMEKARAIYHLLKSLYEVGVLWHVVGSLCSTKSKWDRIETEVKVIAMLVAALATNGNTLMMKTLLALESAYEFGKKMANLTEISKYRKNL